MNITKYMHPFCQLLKADLTVYFRQSFGGHVINNLIWSSSSMFSFTYILPHLGLSTEYGSFYAVGCLASSTIFGIFLNVALFASDLAGDKNINQQLLVPMPSYLVLYKNMAFYTIRAAALAIILLPLAIIILGSNFDLSHFSIPKFLIMYFLCCLVSSALSIIIQSYVTDLNKIEDIWNRFLFPIWYFGGTQFSWFTLAKFSKTVSYICLTNPFIYVVEGLRVAILGQQNYLPFWICVLVSLASSIILSTIGIMRLRKKLDFV